MYSLIFTLLSPSLPSLLFFLFPFSLSLLLSVSFKSCHCTQASRPVVLYGWQLSSQVSRHLVYWTRFRTPTFYYTLWLCSPSLLDSISMKSPFHFLDSVFASTCFRSFWSTPKNNNGRFFSKLGQMELLWVFFLVARPSFFLRFLLVVRSTIYLSGSQHRIVEKVNKITWKKKGRDWRTEEEECKIKIHYFICRSFSDWFARFSSSLSIAHRVISLSNKSAFWTSWSNCPPTVNQSWLGGCLSWIVCIFIASFEFLSHGRLSSQCLPRSCITIPFVFHLGVHSSYFIYLSPFSFTPCCLGVKRFLAKKTTKRRNFKLFSGFLVSVLSLEHQFRHWFEVCLPFRCV